MAESGTSAFGWTSGRKQLPAETPFEIEHRAPLREHFCKLPGWWRRRRLSLGVGSLIRCKGCGTQWVFSRSRYAGHTGWQRSVTPRVAPKFRRGTTD